MQKNKLLEKTFKTIGALTSLTSNIIFPKRCPFCGKVIGFEQCNACDANKEKCYNNISQSIEHSKFNIPNLQSAYAPLFHSDFTKPMLSRLKFNGELYLLEYCANLMIANLKMSNSTLDYDKIVCVPSFYKEHKNRDNIPYLLAKIISKKLNIPFENNLLIKVKETKRQTSLLKEERFENVLDAFDVSDRTRVKSMKFLIIDDVLTTGSTLNDCARALLKADALLCDSLCIFVSSKV